MLGWVLIALVTVVWVWGAGADVKDIYAVGTSLGVLTLVLLVLWGVNRSQGGFLAPLRDPGHRLSTSSTQAGLWTVVLAFAFTFFGARLAFGAMTHTEFLEAAETFTPTYLLLLGGPFAAAALVRLNYNAKKDDGSVQKTSDVETRLSQVITNDAGRTSLNDCQFFLFNCVAIAIFIVMLANQPSELPEIPETLVGLTSVSALAYVTTKAVANQKPLISTIVRADTTTADTFNPGSPIEIRGFNFVPEGANGEDLNATRVRFKSSVESGPTWVVGADQTADNRDPVKKIARVESGRVYATIPPAITPAAYDVQVVTVTGAESDGYRLTVTATTAEASTNASG
jgi:hypothetical protein